MTQETKNIIRELVYNLDNRPSIVRITDIDVIKKEDYIDITLFGNYHNRIYLKDEDNCLDISFIDDMAGYGKEDLLYAYEILSSRNEILDILNEDKNIFVGYRIGVTDYYPYRTKEIAKKVRKEEFGDVYESEAEMDRCIPLIKYLFLKSCGIEENTPYKEIK